MAHRSKLELIALILDSAVRGSGAPLTHIMYYSFISYSQLKKFFPSIVKSGLLEESENGKVYKTTEKVRRYLALVRQLEELLEPE